jgi:hypothetical protein
MTGRRAGDIGPSSGVAYAPAFLDRLPLLLGPLDSALAPLVTARMVSLARPTPAAYSGFLTCCFL